MNSDLPVAAISGAAGDLGRAAAARLAEAGFAIAASGRSAERLDALGSELDLPDDNFHAHTADLTDPAAATAWRDSVVDHFGRADALIHLVGGWKGSESLISSPPEDYEWLHDQLVRTTQNATVAFYNDLIASPRGRFVLIGSSATAHPSGGNAAYAAAKAAAETWTLALADDFRPADATANIIAITAILTEAMRANGPKDSHAAFTPTEDIADAIAFVCSERASRMNGQRLALHP